MVAKIRGTPIFFFFGKKPLLTRTRGQHTMDVIQENERLRKELKLTQDRLRQSERKLQDVMEKQSMSKATQPAPLFQDASNLVSVRNVIKNVLLTITIMYFLQNTWTPASQWTCYFLV